MSTDRQECHEEITRNGELQPCERPAVGYRVDPAHDVPYPVCRPHLREPVFVPPLQLARIGYLGGKFATEKRASYREWIDWLIKSVCYPFDMTFDGLPPVDPVALALRWKELDNWDATDEEAIALVREEMGL